MFDCPLSEKGATSSIIATHVQPFARSLFFPPPKDIDAAYALRCMFIDRGVEECVRLVSPSLFMMEVPAGPTQTKPMGAPDAAVDSRALTFEEVPCESLAMWPNVFLAMDSFDRVLIWRGRGLRDQGMPPSPSNFAVALVPIVRRFEVGDNSVALVCLLAWVPKPSTSWKTNALLRGKSELPIVSHDQRYRSSRYVLALELRSNF